MAFERVQIGEHVLYRGDCLEVMPTLGSIDVTITDPPYGVGFQYKSHDDRHDGYAEWCAEWFSILTSPLVAISCGIANIGMWSNIRQPSWILAWHKPAAMGRCAVGFNNWEPVILYGKPSKQICDVFKACIVPDDSIDDHPCPKPLAWATWQVHNLSKPEDTVLDPFMGSGTTGVACSQTGRKFIGVEKEPAYFNLACRRIEAAEGKGSLFEERKPEQLLFAEA